MMKKLNLLLLSVFLTSCNYMELYNVPDEENRGTGTGEQQQCTTPIDPSTVITFDTLKSEVLENGCIGCHSAGNPRGGIDLSSYFKAKPLASRIQFVVERGLMPKAPVTITAEQKNKIITWVKQGAVNSLAELECNEQEGQTPVEPVPPEDELVLTKVPPVEQINFKLVKEKILQTNCLACHSNSGGNRGRVNLETYENVEDEIDDVLEQVEFGMMPPAPRPSLTAIELEVLNIWVKNGMPE